MSPINVIWHCKARIPLSSSQQNSTVPPPSDNWHCSSYLEHIPSASEEFWYNLLIIMAWTAIGITVIGSFIAILAAIFVFIKAIKENQEWENSIKANSKQLLAEKDGIKTESKRLLTEKNNIKTKSKRSLTKKKNRKAKSKQLLAETERQDGGIEAECQSLLTKDSGNICSVFSPGDGEKTC
ncbi:uncharacterized protein EAE97_009904 [Botrytis byssoidea]|uniref:Uncharacterized protein n=1 Tax=Botrytis byssoidea TaxID=139641 RepID=A0A9P5I6F5_9HELO|nr:uncharacterized protein EAE97_009904 [Botrytis byssoidea]KAF7928106.1 hypothetical protein EAE97_009904 [Botrytis byssoidea]